MEYHNFNERHAHTLNITQRDVSSSNISLCHDSTGLAPRIHIVLRFVSIFTLWLCCFWSSAACSKYCLCLIKRANVPIHTYTTGYNNVSVIIANLVDLINISNCNEIDISRKFTASPSHSLTQLRAIANICIGIILL